MTIEICAVSGYSDFGRNMTAINVDGETILVDIGLHIENYINYTDDEEFVHVDANELIKLKAAPDVSLIDDWKNTVTGIIPSHAHLDHLGAAPFLAGRFSAPIFGTPFTMEVLKNILQGEKVDLPNKIIPIAVNGSKKVGKLKIELINMTHSTPQTAAIAIHTPQGIVVYMCDFKLDETPTLGPISNVKRLKELGEKGVIALILDSTNAKDEGNTPSEAVAKEMLNEVVAGIRQKDIGIITTTFSSHLARLKSLLELGQKIDRKVMFLGRSMGRYIEAGEAANIIKFSTKAKVFKYRNQIETALKKVAKEGKEKYLLVVSGHQGEPKSTLSKMVGGLLDYKLDPKDYVIFSCRVIPVPSNKKNREQMERTLKKQGVHIFKDIHQSGHGAQDDLLTILDLLKPKNLIPAHGNRDMREALAALAKKEGYDKVHLLSDGERVKIK